MGSTSTHAASADGQPVVVVFAADERYAMPLAAAVRSVLDNASPHRELHVYVIDCGLAASTLEALDASWDLGAGRRVIRTAAPTALVERLPVWDCYGMSVYSRLVLPRILPSHVGRAVYLDSDVLAFGDVCRLFDEPLGGHPLGAVRDAGIPTARHRGLPGDELGLESGAPYFNSGVLLLDVDRWRTADIGRRLLDCVRAKRRWIRWPDQDALNAVLAGHWQELSPRWNAFMGYIRPRRPPRCPGVAARYAELDGLPDIGHYVAIHKPWEPECDLFARKLFFQYLDRTAWKGWRPRAVARPRPSPPTLCSS